VLGSQLPEVAVAVVGQLGLLFPGQFVS
jgi:hypothetical protein